MPYLFQYRLLRCEICVYIVQKMGEGERVGIRKRGSAKTWQWGWKRLVGPWQLLPATATPACHAPQTSDPDRSSCDRIHTSKQHTNETSADVQNCVHKDTSQAEHIIQHKYPCRKQSDWVGYVVRPQRAKAPENEPARHCYHTRRWVCHNYACKYIYIYLVCVATCIQI